MNQKPADLMLGVIEFLGILVPGAVLMFLRGDLLLGPLGLTIGTLQTPANAVVAFFVAYLLGHFVFGFSEHLNRLAVRRLSKDTRVYFDSVRERVPLPEGVKRTPAHVFNAAFSYIRLHSPAALVELEQA